MGAAAEEAPKLAAQAPPNAVEETPVVSELEAPMVAAEAPPKAAEAAPVASELEAPMAASEGPLKPAEEAPVASEEAAPMVSGEATPMVASEGPPEVPADVTTPPAPPSVQSVPSFKEESYRVKDLKDSERKALADLKAKIEEAIRANAFLEPPKISKAASAKDGEPEKKEEEAIEAEKKQEEGEEGAAVAAAKDGDTIEASAEAAIPTGAAESKIEGTVEPSKSIETSKIEEALDVDKKDTPPDVAAIELPVEETSREVVVEKAEIPPVTATVEPPPEEASREVVTEEQKEVEDDSPPLDDLALWGIPLLHSKGDERTDVLLLKFLRARDFKVKDALSMLQDTMAWRKDFNADGLVEEEISAPEFESMAYMHGFDKEGHPVCYNKELYQKAFDDEEQVKKFLRWRIQMLEKSIANLDFHATGVHSMVQVTDFKDYPAILLKRSSITKKVLSVLQDNYPELVAKQIFINVPWYIGVIYLLHGKFLTPRSKSKVVIARPGKVAETLFKYISPDNVPLQYGGLSRLDDFEFKGVEAPVKELIIKAGDRQTIEITVDESVSTVTWDVSCVGWEVTYEEQFVPKEEASYTVIIQKARKLASSEEPVRNSFKANEPGKVVITIDNSASRRKKVVVYRYKVVKA